MSKYDLVFNDTNFQEFYELKDSKVTKKIDKEKSGTWNFNFFDSILSYISLFFLPVGYPNTVSSDYTKFHILDMVQSFCSYLRMILSTKAIFEGMGFGSSGASSAAATIQWVFRDGVGMFTTLIFSYWGSLRMDEDPCTFRLLADILFTFALFLDMLTAHYPSFFLLLSSISTILKIITAICADCTRISFNLHFAKAKNIIDIKTKEGNQKILMNSMGLLFSLIFANYLSILSPTKIWISFIILTVTHLVINYYLVKSVELNIINRQRLVILYEYYLKNKAIIPTKDICQKESLFYEFVLKFTKNKIIFGDSGNSFKDMSFEEIVEFLDYFKDRKYFVIPKKNKQCFSVCFEENTDIKDICKLYLTLYYCKSYEFNEFKNQEAEIDRNFLDFWTLLERDNIYDISKIYIGKTNVTVKHIKDKNE